MQMYTSGYYNMRKATIFRQPSTKDGTPGRYVSDSGLTFQTIERPWLNNKRDVSCIPEGVYQAVWGWSQKHSCNLYRLTGVPDRDDIEIHPANVYQQLMGCASMGSDRVLFKRDSIRPGCPDRDMLGVTDSKAAIFKFERDMVGKDNKQESFELEFKNV